MIAQKDYDRMLRRSYKKCPHKKAIEGYFVKCHICKVAFPLETMFQIAREINWQGYRFREGS